MTLDSINAYVPDYANSMYWLWFSAKEGAVWEPGASALHAYLPEQNEEILLAYGVLPLRIEGTTTPAVDATTTYIVTAFDVNAWTWVPAPDSVIPGFEEYGTTSSTGFIDLRFATITPVTMTAVRRGYVSSRPLVVTPAQSITEEIQTII